MRTPIALCALLALTGCVSLSEEECIGGNWDEIGFRDGTNGETSAHIQKHVKACEKSGIRPNQSVWEKGRQRGLPVYCTPTKAYSVGKQGYQMNAVCPASQAASLQAAHSTGREYFQYTREINNVRTEIRNNENRIAREQDPTLRSLLLQENRTLAQSIRLLELRRSTYGSL